MHGRAVCLSMHFFFFFSFFLVSLPLLLAQLLSCLTALSPHYTVLVCVCVCVCEKVEVSSTGLQLCRLDNPTPDKTSRTVTEPPGVVPPRAFSKILFIPCFSSLFR